MKSESDRTRPGARQQVADARRTANELLAARRLELARELAARSSRIDQARGGQPRPA